MQTLIKDSRGNTRGYTIDNGYDHTELHNSSGKLLGYYSKHMDKTFSASGAYVGNGNQLSFLFQET